MNEEEIIILANSMSMVRGYYDESGCYPNALIAFAARIREKDFARISELEEVLLEATDELVRIVDNSKSFVYAVDELRRMANKGDE